MALPLAVCVLVRHLDRYLFVERAPGRFAAGYWTPVTGRLLPDESLSVAAAREVLEETGLAVVVGRSLGRTGTDAPGGGRAGYELVWFEATLAPGASPDAVVLQEEEVSAARWVTLDEALGLSPLFATTRAFMASLRRE